MANNRIDIALDQNDLVISNNDLVMIESDDQHIADTINACPGWWKENYSDGVAIITYLKGRGVQQELARSIKLNLQSDLYSARPQVTFDNNGTLNIDTNVTN